MDKNFVNHNIKLLPLWLAAVYCKMTALSVSHTHNNEIAYIYRKYASYSHANHVDNKPLNIMRAFKQLMLYVQCRTYRKPLQLNVIEFPVSFCMSSRKCQYYVYV